MEPLLTFDTLRGAFDNMAEAVVIFDAQYTVLYQNHAALELNRLPTGITRSELEQVIERFKPDGAPLPVEDSPVSRALRGETVRDEAIHVHRKALGDTRVWIYNAVPIRDDSGAVVRAVLNVRDVTEQKRQQTELEQATRALKESNQDLERFASIAAHDLK